MSVGTAGRRIWITASLAVAALVSAACVPSPPQPGPTTTTTTVVDPLPQTPVGDDTVRLNQIQLAGSHNSYHVAPERRIIDLLVAGAAAFPAIAGGLGDPASLDYTHASLPDQLAAGIRTFELDVWADPAGGRFTYPKLDAIFGFRDPELDAASLREPGFKVFHIADIDQRSRCALLETCLSELRTWSDAHPGHLPVIIDLELKDDVLPAPLVGTPVVPFAEAQFQALDAQLRSSLGDRLITPDDIRGAASTLNEAITTVGWPSVAAARGKFMFFLDNEAKRDAYVAGHPTLQGRVLFTSSGEGQPDGAFIKVNDPTELARIQSLVEEGYMVRTRADANLAEANANDSTHRDLALSSGAQIVHSDFPPNEPHRNGYVVTFGTRVAARCNPLNTTPASCGPLAVVEAA
ncbi:MAG: phosphatidylinositol-specific phospholipase C1-like protein [Microthrixaceae bacterium]|nr:phosphatidylinositol-specific phospholipase C1-like protein [Microthrixaceae bacterium]